MIYIWPDSDVHDTPVDWKSDDYFTIPHDATYVEVQHVLHSHFGKGTRQYADVMACVLEELANEREVWIDGEPF